LKIYNQLKKTKTMKKLILITVCAFGLAFAGSAATQTAAKKEGVKKETVVPAKGVKKTKKVAVKKEAATPAKPATTTTTTTTTSKPIKK
jgi:hypothetical protein